MSSSDLNLPEIGKTLAQIRQEQDLSLETVAAQTLISKRVLVAIEKGKTKELPEAFYTKALVQKYAKALKAESLLAKIAPATEESNPTAQEQNKSSSLWSKHQEKPKIASVPIFQLKSSHLYFLYLVLVVIAIRAIASVVEQPVIVQEQILPEQELVTETARPVTDSTPTTISSATPSQFVSQSNSNNAESVVVDILLKDRCWLKVMVDGKVEFEGTLPKGTKRSWTGTEQINIIAGNAGGVVVTYNHGKEKLLGKPGEVEEVTYRRVN